MSAAVADIAVIGLAVMGQNLILNMNDHGFVVCNQLLFIIFYIFFSFFFLQVCAFNRTVQKVTDFLNNEAKGTKIVGATSMEEMVKWVF